MEMLNEGEQKNQETVKLWIHVIDLPVNLKYNESDINTLRLFDWSFRALRPYDDFISVAYFYIL